MKWINIKDKLPPVGKYVIAKHNRGTWHDSDDMDNVNTVIVKLEMGISMEERKNMIECERKYIYRHCDEHGNNLTPYSFSCFGSDHFFGQKITHWIPIPDMEDNRK